jgi:L-lactate dehydrogenase complex protein LldG
VSAAREAVLGRIRAALDDRGPIEPVPRDYATTWSGGDAVELFAQRVAEYRATVRRVNRRNGGPGSGGHVAASATPVTEVEAAVREALAAHDARRVAIPGDLPDAWRPPGVELVVDAGLTPRELDELDGALTGCALAIAQTGTIVLDGGPAQGRRALTLVPDLHICVVRADQVVGSLPEAFAALAGHPRPITLVSGPSATSDIELERVEGVHGPRRLEVLLVG